MEKQFEVGRSGNFTQYEVVPVDKLKRVRFYTSIDQGSFVSPHWHDAIEIIYIEEGCLTVSDDTGDHQMEAGHILLTNANYVHSTKCVAPNRAIVFQIPLDFFRPYVADIDTLRFNLENLTEKSAETLDKVGGFIEKLKRMQAVNDGETDGGSLLFNSLLFDALFDLYRNFSQKIGSVKIAREQKDMNRLKPVLEFTKNHYTEKISIEEASRIAMLEDRYFCRFFKKKMGMTYLEYLNDIRLSHIYYDLLNSGDSLADILDRHGFSNYKLFRRLFYEHFGMTPMQLRASAKNGTPLK